MTTTYDLDLTKATVSSDIVLHLISLHMEEAIPARIAHIRDSADAAAADVWKRAVTSIADLTRLSFTTVWRHLDDQIDVTDI